VNGLVCDALPELLAAVDLPAWSAEIARLRAALIPHVADAAVLIVAQRVSTIAHGVGWDPREGSRIYRGGRDVG